MASERIYQGSLVKKLQRLFPGCMIMENDPNQIQGIPDLLILFRRTWAMLEVKADAYAPERPNQAYYIDMFANMSFASFIFPEIEEQVLHDLSTAFGVGR